MSSVIPSQAKEGFFNHSSNREGTSSTKSIVPTLRQTIVPALHEKLCSLVVVLSRSVGVLILASASNAMVLGTLLRIV